MKSLVVPEPLATARGGQDVAFALAVVFMLTVLILPVPAFILDVGLAASLAASVLILMVALWIQKPLEFSSFPTVLLIVTMLRLTLNVATTRLILSHGNEGHSAAGHVIAGFANFVMGGDFVIGLVVFVILITVNFVVITKGATRIAEVGARFTLDAMPGKQMAIDADLNAGIIDEKEATRRRRELEDESAFFGAMDGASKFVRGDAIAGIVITAINIVGGIVVGVSRHSMSLASAGDVYVKLSVGDGLVTQIPALVISLASGLLISKGGTRGSTEKAVLGQLGGYPRALAMGAGVMLVLALAPNLPFVPFFLLAALFGIVAYQIPRRREAAAAAEKSRVAQAESQARDDARMSVKESLRTAEIEVSFGTQLAIALMPKHGELAQRVAKMRRKFAEQYGFVLPDIRLADDRKAPPKGYSIKLSGTVVARGDLRIGDVLVVTGEGRKPPIPGDETREPAFGMKAQWYPAMLADKLRQDGFTPVDPSSVLLTHLGEVIKNSLPQLLSYRDVRQLVERLDPEYKRLLDELVPAQITYSGLQNVLKLLLAERVSIRNLHIILEAIAESVPHVRRAEQLAENVRARLAQQICGELSEGGALSVLRLGSRWELAFHQAMKRDAKGEVVEFAMEPQQIEQFSTEAAKSVRRFMDEGVRFALVTSPDARPFVRMITDRQFPTLSVLSHSELARGWQLNVLGSVS